MWRSGRDLQIPRKLSVSRRFVSDPFPPESTESANAQLHRLQYSITGDWRELNNLTAELAHIYVLYIVLYIYVCILYFIYISICVAPVFVNSPLPFGTLSLVHGKERHGRERHGRERDMEKRDMEKRGMGNRDAASQNFPQWRGMKAWVNRC